MVKEDARLLPGKIQARGSGERIDPAQPRVRMNRPE
jgi:hypothetical protein